MGNFKRNNAFDGRRSGGGFSGRNSGRAEMHKAICSECGKDCEVPFKPSGNKPVLCSDCFRGKGGADQRRSGKDFGKFGSSDRKFGSGDRKFGSSDKRMHEAICDECGKKCEVPFKPTSGKPIYCSECFGKEDKGGKGDSGYKDKGSDQAGKQFEIINAKLDKILKSLNPVIPMEVNEEKKPIEKTRIVKPKKISKSNGKKNVSAKKPKIKKKK